MYQETQTFPSNVRGISDISYRTQWLLKEWFLEISNSFSFRFCLCSFCVYKKNWAVVCVLQIYVVFTLNWVQIIQWKSLVSFQLHKHSSETATDHSFLKKSCAAGYLLLLNRRTLAMTFFVMEKHTFALRLVSDKIDKCWKVWLSLSTHINQISSKRASVRTPGSLLHTPIGFLCVWF